MRDERMVELLVELHQGLPRLGPGSRDSTLRALALCEHLPPAPDILDIGCGTGAQTLDLASATDGRITAVDLFDPFLRQLSALANVRDLAGRIRTLVADMNTLPFGPASFDLVWSEGAAYNMGFDQAATKWPPLLRPGGYLALSELCWFHPSPADELKAYWAENYPLMRGVQDNIAAATTLGLEAIGNFHLPVSAWTDDYYGPLSKRLPAFRASHADDEEAQEVADMTEREMSLMERFQDAYGYEFFVFRRA